MTDVMGVVLAGLAGLAFGSFANVAIHRVPGGESVVRPASRCPSCRAAIARRDNIPVVSWLLLRGRCRACSARISARYPAVELITAGLFALTAARLSSWDLIAFLPLMLVLVVLSGIDIDHKLLPNKIVLPAIPAFAALLFVSALIGPGVGDWVRAIAGGAAAFGGMLLIALISPRGMGMGDVKLSALLGTALAYQSWAVLFLGYFAAFLSGAVGGVLLMVAGRGGRKSEIPFGPYLALGTIIGVLWGPSLADLWLGR